MYKYYVRKMMEIPSFILNCIHIRVGEGRQAELPDTLDSKVSKHEESYFPFSTNLGSQEKWGN